VNTKLQPIYSELCEKLDEWGLPRKIHNVACYVEKETPEDKSEFERLSRMKGYDSSRPDPDQPRLTMLERKAVVENALRTFLGTQILVDQGVPEYKIEATILRLLVFQFQRAAQGKVLLRYQRNDEYGIAYRGLSLLYENQKAPWVKRGSDDPWTRIISGKAWSRSRDYANDFRLAIDFHNCQTPQETQEEVLKLKSQVDSLLGLAQKIPTHPNVIAGLKISQKELERLPAH
jgi:hypothetical protein